MTDWFTCGVRNEWRLLFKHTYCTSLTLIKCEIERDRMSGTLNIEALLFGLGFWLCIAVEPPSREFMEALEAVAKPQEVGDD